MTRERRSLWKNISTSMKVNGVSMKASLVYTWGIPHLDDEGFMDGDPRILKGKVVPLRDEISVEDLKKITQELVQAGLWVVHRVNGNVFIQDPVFNEYQTFHGVRKKPSRIKELLDRTPQLHQSDTDIGDDLVQGGCINEVKGSEEKGNEVKGSQINTTESILLLFRENCPNLPQAKELNKSRREKIKSRLQEHADLDWWIEVFRKADTVMIPGRDGRKDWTPTFDWLIENDKNAVKVIEGNYDQRAGPFRPQPGIKAFLEKEKENRDGA